MSAAAWVTLAILILMVIGIVQMVKKREISDEEFEREAKRPSLVRTGFQEFQTFFEPEKKAALEVVKKEQRKTEQQTSGDSNR